MKASDLIVALQENIAKHGDIDVVAAVGRELRPVKHVFGAIEELGENWPTYDSDGNFLVIQTGNRS